MIEALADDEAAGEQRRGLVGLALRPERRAESDIDPRLRIVGRLGGPLRERLAHSLERRRLAADRTEDHGMPVDRDHQGPHDFGGSNQLIERRYEHASLLHDLLGIGSGLADRDRVGQLCGPRVANTAAPGGLRWLLSGPQGLLRKLHREQPLRIGGSQQECLLVGCGRLAKVAEFELAFTDRGAGGDRIDPPLATDPHARSIFVAGDFQGSRRGAG